MSTSLQMFVRLKADGSVASKGFKANFTRGCGARITTEAEGVLTSPDWPHTWRQVKYFHTHVKIFLRCGEQARDTCDWVISGARATDRVTLTLTFLQLSNELGAEVKLSTKLHERFRNYQRRHRV